MTAPFRPIVLAIGLLLLAGPAADAATTSAYNLPNKLVTLTNDSTAESFTVAINNSATPATYKVTTTSAALPVPPGSNCSSSDAGKSINCTTTDVAKIAIKGGAGNDSFTISGTTDYYSSPGLSIDGEAGDDTFTATDTSALNLNITGGADNDTFIGSNANADSFYAEPGNDTYQGGTRPVPAGFDAGPFQLAAASDSWSPTSTITLRGQRRADTPVNISLDGQANDADSLGGTDNVSDDIESLTGTSANDTLSGGAHSVNIAGQAGDDVITGSSAADELYGGAGSDTIRGGAGDDELNDGDFEQVYRLAGNPEPVRGNDTLDGGDGDDRFTYAAGKDDVTGGAGVDTVLFTRLDTQILDSSPSTAVPPKWLPISISLDDQANDGAAGEGDNVHSDVENVDTSGQSLGMAYRSTRIGYGDLLASNGSDTITGSAAANSIITGGGNDSVDALGGTDVIDVGSGDDQVNAIDKATDVIRCGAGTDNVGADLAGTNAGRADVVTDCENVTGTPLGLEGGVLPTLPVKPKLTVNGTTSYKVAKFLRTYTITSDVTTDQAATATGTLTYAGGKIAKVGALTIGSSKLKSGTGKRKLKTKVAVKFRKAIKRKLKTKKQRRKGIKLSLAVTVTNAAGQATTSTKTIKIKG